jgi:hypothetical protein
MGYKTSHGADTRQQIYDWIKGYKAEHGYMPTIKEVSEGPACGATGSCGTWSRCAARAGSSSRTGRWLGR